MPPTGPFAVVIAGGGVAAIETAVALSQIAAGLVELTLLAPDEELVYRALAGDEPFGLTAPQRYPMTRVADALGAELIEDRLAWVDRSARVVHTESAGELHYDALVLCLGADARPRYEHALTIDGRSGDALRGLLDVIANGDAARLAFVVPERMAWPLPLYEAALLSVARAADDRLRLEATVLTSEHAPLEIFGDRVSGEVSKLLATSGIELVGSVRCEVPSAGVVLVGGERGHGAGARPGSAYASRRLSVDRVVSLPELYGPHVRGLPGAVNGFIAVNRYCRVRGAQRIYAAGDATDFPVKHAGIAVQQADVAAEAIAALAGAPIRPSPLLPTIRGVLITGGEPRYLSARITGGHAFGSRLDPMPAQASQPTAGAGYLAPYLEKIGL